MRKSRFVPLTAVLLIVALCSWAWWERDRVAPVLINALIEGGRIDAIHGLKFSFGQTDIERLDISLDSGAKLQLEEMRLVRPFSMIFSTGRNRARVTIEKLKFSPPEATVSDVAAPERRDAQPEQDFKLSDASKVLLAYLPEQLQISELIWPENGAQSAALELHRDHERHTISANLSSGEQQLSLQIQPQERQLELVARLGTRGHEPALSLHGNLIPTDSGTWRAAAQLDSDLEQLTGLPLAGSLDDIAASASGQLAASVEAEIPDELFHFQGYRKVSAKLHSESLQLTLPEELLGVPLELLLSTDGIPIDIALTSLQPIRGERVSGSATVKLTPAGQKRPLLDLSIETDTDTGIPVIGLKGTLNLEAAGPLLKAPRWQERLKAITIDSPSGAIGFDGTAKMKPLHERGDGNQHWLSDASLTLVPDSRAKFSFAVEADKDRIKGKVIAQLLEALKLHIPHWPGTIQMTGGPVTLQLATEGSDTPVRSKLQQINCMISEESNCSLRLAATAERIAHSASKLSIRKPSVDTQLNFTLQANGQRWLFHHTDFSAQGITSDSIGVDNLRLTSPLLDCTLANGKQTCNSKKLRADFALVKADQLTASGAVNFDNFQFQQHSGKQQLSSRYSSEGLKFTAQGSYQLEPLLNGKLDFQDQRLSGEGHIRLGSLRTQTTWHHDLESAKGFAAFTLEEAKFSQQQPLSKAVQGLPLDIVAGKVAAKGSLSWPQDRSSRDTADIELNNVAVVYKDSFATGVQAKLTLSKRTGHWLTAEPRPVKIDTLDVGLPIKDIRFAVSLDEKGDLKLGDVGAKLLSGTLQSEALTWNLNGEERRSLVLLNEISLRELARETEAGNFAASGIIDMRIPLLTNADGITVEKGTIEARPPGGRLRYYGAFSAEMLSTNPQLKLIAGALEDYNYRALSGTLEYPPSGDMQLQLKLIGRSQSVDADRDLIINLNLENNIPAMLRSLQASRDLSEALERQIQ
ncbi:intermembrane phospholipid transport protein YdbH family protein [Microbulbifer marinus]|uniref:Dicarboxylate transport n=1 Tax=Microbulbifer marinus TaxID=658218 RepID=A0A1H3ZYX9_9GAMM|nr:YdbH domain-containing protein [Microbulbifer marinus]SEA28847.1 Dicarboxylate transport [Microbulbifer marinus]